MAGRLGVVIGRFQTPRLHEGHMRVLRTVFACNDAVLILVGETGHGQPTANNPLSYLARSRMLMYAIDAAGMRYPHQDYIFRPLRDMHDDVQWSAQVDSIIDAAVGHFDMNSVALFAGRDSFAPHYFGKHQILYLDASTGYSSTELRRAAVQHPEDESFIRGAIWTTQKQYPKVHPTVDVICIKDGDWWKDENDSILIGRKAGRKKWCFPGGFAEPTSESFEADVLRELEEEAGLVHVTPPRYVTSMLIDDWRYRKEVDKVKTLLYVVRYIDGEIRAGDDLEEVQWLDFSRTDPREVLQDEHIPLWEAVEADVID